MILIPGYNAGFKFPLEIGKIKLHYVSFKYKIYLKINLINNNINKRLHTFTKHSVIDTFNLSFCHSRFLFKSTFHDKEATKKYYCCKKWTIGKQTIIILSCHSIMSFCYYHFLFKSLLNNKDVSPPPLPKKKKERKKERKKKIHSEIYSF